MPITVKTLLVLWLGVMPATLWAHASQIEAEPGAGATVQSTPFDVRISFDARLQPAASRLRVEDAHGDVVSDGDGEVDPDNPKLLFAHVASAPAGLYHVFWVVVSRDGHRTQGDYTFTVR